MAVEIRVPELAESVVEATVARWLKQPGESVAQGEPVVELETEKINLGVAAEQGGVLREIARRDGETVKAGDVLGLIDQRAAAAAPSAGDAGTQRRGDAESEVAVTPRLSVSASPVTPVAQRLAEEHGIDASRMRGSGLGGRVTKDDVLEYLERPGGEATPPAPPREEAASTPAPPAVAPTPAAAPPAGERREERVRLSRRRLTIARRLVEAQQAAAMVTTFNEVDLSAVMELRRRRRDSFKERYGVGLGFMSFFTKAAIGALKAFPQINAELQGEELVIKHYYDIGIAVSTDEGLVVPVLRDSDKLTFAEIEQQIAALSTKARERKLTLEDLRGGTFTITNGGVFGSLLSTPILNPPQVGILGMHKIEERPVAVGGQVVVRSMMYVALTYDHRVVDGREAVRFLVRVKELIEDPALLLIEE